MGGKSIRNQEFLKQNPYCCFCGGTSKSDELDHIPSRVLFDDRQWPEGYVFPACIPCNRVTRNVEQVVALLSRLYPDAVTEGSKTKIVDLFRAVDRNYPGVLEEMKLSPRQARDAIKKYGLTKPMHKTTVEMPLLYAGGPLVNDAVQAFGRKLFLALYYFHTRKALRKEGGIIMRWFTNLQIDNDVIPKEIADIVNQFPKLERSRIDLADQFFYRYGLSDDHNVAVFLAFFRRSFAILGFLQTDREKFEPFENTRIFTPYDYNYPA